MKKFCFVACVLALSLLVVCCGGKTEYDPYVKLIVNHMVESGVDEENAPVYGNARSVYEVLKGHTLEGDLSVRIHDDLALNGYAITKYFTVAPKSSQFKAGKDYVHPESMPAKDLIESEIKDIENLLFFGDVEVYAYYAKSAKSNQNFRVKCLNFEGVEYGRRPQVAEVEVGIRKGEELSTDLLKEKIRTAAGNMMSMDGGKFMFATYSGDLYDVPSAATAGDAWYTPDYAIDEAKLGNALNTIKESNTIQKICVGYKWTKSKSSLQFKINGLELRSGDCVNVIKGVIPVDAAVLTASTPALEALSEYVRNTFFGANSSITLPQTSSGQQVQIKVGDEYYTKLSPSADLLYVRKDRVASYPYGKLGIIDYVKTSNIIDLYKSGGAGNMPRWNQIIGNVADIATAGWPLKNVYKTGTIDVSVFRPWMDVSASSSNEVYLYMIYKVAH